MFTWSQVDRLYHVHVKRAVVVVMVSAAAVNITHQQFVSVKLGHTSTFRSLVSRLVHASTDR